MVQASTPPLAQTHSQPQQQTLAQPFEREGVGLHSGQSVRVRVLPAAAGGRYFVRTDRPDAPVVPATLDQVSQTQLSTQLGLAAPVRTVEHLLAALWGLGIDHARIEVDGPELPLLDGSAQPWVAAIAQAGVQSLPQPRLALPELAAPLSVRAGDAFVTAQPAPTLRFSYGIDFDGAAIGNQWHSWSPQQEAFAQAIAPARTFGLAHQIDHLRRQGLIQGGSLDNALVCEGDRWLNPPLRFENEPVRHKLLDLVGDLSLLAGLLGTLPTLHIVAYKASHQLHVQLAQKLAAVYAANRQVSLS